MEQDRLNAEQYAIQKLCTEIPYKYLNGSTYWDKYIKKCRISEKGCNNLYKANPFTQPTYDANGNDITSSYMNTTTLLKDFWKYNPPEELVWKGTKSSRGKLVCARSNHFLKRFCEYPRTRGSDDGSKKIPGVTNVPKFNYTVSQGKETCKVNKDYCDAKGLSFNSSNAECVLPGGQKAFENMFGGSVIARSIRAGVPPPNMFNPKELSGTIKKFKEMSDSRLKRNIIVHKTDFLDKGIHLYKFTWTPEAKKLYNITHDRDLGFIADELPSEYVGTDLNGYKYIHTEQDSEISKRLDFFYKIKMLFTFK